MTATDGGPVTGTDQSRRGDFVAWLALMAVTVLAYRPALSAGFIWDDDGHVTRPDLRPLHGLWRIWFQIGATQQYYPVLHSAFWLEHRLWGDAPLGYHLLNILLHALAAGLFALVLQAVREDRRMRTCAWFAAGLFALHPVGVESVAWVSEQKNTLSTVFYLLSALVYVRWDERRGAARYALALVLFLLALLSKSVTATLPAALLVAIWWKRGRLSWRRDVLPLAPWFALAAAVGAVTAWVEEAFIGARGARFALSFGRRILLAGRDVWFYLGKLIWPARLVFIYPHWSVETWPAWRAAFPLAAVGLIGLAWRMRRRSRAPLAGLLFFVGSLFPALGFFNVYPFVFSYVADHFQYLASLGVFALAAGGWGAWALGRDCGAASAAPIRPNRWAMGAAAGVLAAFGLLTWRAAGAYRDMETLYRTTIERNPASWLAQENLGVVLANEGRWAEAISRYRIALRLNPAYAETHANYGNALARAGDLPAAVAQYRAALQLRPDFLVARANWAKAEYAWASALGNAGRLDEAIAHYGEALRLRPDFPEAMAELGLAQVYAGRPADALAGLRRAVRLKPDYPPAHAYLGLALARLGRYAEAAAEFRAALRLDPSDADVRYQLGLAEQALGSGGGEAPGERAIR